MNRKWLWVLALAFVLGIGCGSGSDACDDDVVGEVPEVSIEGLTVLYESTEYPVTFEGLESQLVDEIPMIPLVDVLARAELPVPVEELDFDFQSADGFRPAINAACRPYMPLPGSKISQGWVNLEKGSLYFEDSVEASGCFEVPDIALVLAFGKDKTGSIVRVGDEESGVDVDLRFLPNFDFNERLVVAMDTIVRSAMGSPEIYFFELIAYDGFNPAFAGQLGPFPYNKMEVMYVDLLTRQVSWPDDQNIDPLWGFDRLAQVIYLDPLKEGGTIVLEEETDEFFHSQEVDLGTLETVEFNGDQMVPLSTVVEASGIIDAPTGKFYTINNSYGFDPHEQFSGSLVWVDLLNGYIHPVSRNVAFDVNTGVKGYWNVHDAERIRIVQEAG